MERRLIEVRSPHHLETSTLGSPAEVIEWEHARDQEMAILLIVAVLALPLLVVLVLLGTGIATWAPESPVRPHTETTSARA